MDLYERDYKALDTSRWRKRYYMQAVSRKKGYGTCPKCGDYTKLTRDHIVPQWIARGAAHLGIWNLQKDGDKNIQYICGSCNAEKGGAIDVSHKTGLNFWLDVREKINEAIQEQYGVDK